MADFKDFLKDRIAVMAGPIEDMARIGRSGEEIKESVESLNLTYPDLIYSIHNEYIEAGANIIRTNTLNANRISLEEGLQEGYAYEMARSGAAIARKAADAQREKVLVAGCAGPTAWSLTLENGRPILNGRTLSFNDMVSAYQEQFRGLADGGADIIYLESCFDALNTKAALSAIKKICRDIPVMVSLAVNTMNGRTLTGQHIRSFYSLIRHFPIAAFGLDGYLPGQERLAIMEDLANFCSLPLLCSPDAGEIDEKGEYNDSAWHFAAEICRLAEKGLLNIAGGSAGTTPEHICAISTAITDLPPRIPAHTGMRPEEALICSSTQAGIPEDADLETVWKSFRNGKITLPNLELAVNEIIGRTPELDSGQCSEDKGSTMKIIVVTAGGESYDFGSRIFGVALRYYGLDVNCLGILSNTKKLFSAFGTEKSSAILLCGNAPDMFFRAEEICRKLKERKSRQPLMICGTHISALHIAISLNKIYRRTYYCSDPYSCAVMCIKYSYNRRKFEKKEHERQIKIRRAYDDLHCIRHNETERKRMRADDARKYLSRFI